MAHRAFVLAAAAMLALASAPQVALADGDGLAWDSVTRLFAGSDISALQPGSFDADFAAASAIQANADAGGGMMAKAKAAMQTAQTTAKIMQNGLAQKHYVAGTKERTDDIPYGTATIRDCGARTITTLDLKAKTYTVRSMDQPSHDTGNAPDAHAPNPTPTDDGTRIAFDVKNTALGAKQVAGQATQGFQSAVTMTTTRPSEQPQISKVELVAYYSEFSQPIVVCSSLGGFMSGSAGHGPMNPAMAQATRQMASGVLSMMTHPTNRITVTQSGPAFQLGRLSMFDAMSVAGDGGRGTGSAVTERGNVRSIAPNDPVFSVPSDFTQRS